MIISFSHYLFGRLLHFHFNIIISRRRALSIEIFKTGNILSPPFMQKIFKLRTSCYSLRSPNDLAHIRPNQTTFGSNSLMSIGPQIWNNLPNELKSAENLKTFKRLIKIGMGFLADAVLASACPCKVHSKHSVCSFL